MRDGSGIFYYTGEGQVGDMQFRAGNSAIRDHANNGKDVHLFRYVRKAFVEYLGQFVCTGAHTRRAPDINGTEREAIVLELVPLQEFLELDDLARVPEATDSLDSAANLLPSSKEPIYRLQQVRERSRQVRRHVLSRAAGLCEGCGAGAPFMTEKGEPYLEPHHTRRLSDGGPDHPAWVIALCPNCHRRAHYGADAVAFNSVLITRVNTSETPGLN